MSTGAQERRNRRGNSEQRAKAWNNHVEMINKVLGTSFPLHDKNNQPAVCRVPGVAA